MRLNEDLDSNQLSSIWKVFNNWPLMFLVSQQVRGTRGITVHKLFSLAEKWHQFLPDVFVVICLQENLTLYKAHILFSDYVEKSKKKNAKWVSKVIRSSVWTVDFIQKNACKKNVRFTWARISHLVYYYSYVFHFCSKFECFLTEYRYG